MKSSELLIAAKAKIENPENWIKQDYALDGFGLSTIGSDTNAVCFCSLGALQCVTGCDLESTQIDPVLKYLIKAVPESYVKVIDECINTEKNMVGYGYVSRYNDSHSHAEVMQMFDEAIKLALADEEHV